MKHRGLRLNPANFEILIRKIMRGKVKHLVCFLAAVSLFLNGPALKAQDVQWRGPNRDGIYPDSMLLKEWPESGPEKLFVTEGIGRGYSSAVATGEMIYVTGIRDSMEYLTAMACVSPLIFSLRLCFSVPLRYAFPCHYHPQLDEAAKSGTMSH